MRNVRIGAVTAVLSAWCTLVSTHASASAYQAGSAIRGNETQLQHSAAVSALRSIPLSFEENRGQAVGGVRYLARGLGYQLLIAPTETIFSVTSGGAAGKKAPLRVRFDGANRRADGTGLDLLATKSHYYLAQHPGDHLANVPHYAKVQFTDIYPSTDLIYYGHSQEVEYDLIVRPGGDPKRIRLSFESTEQLTLDEAGNLNLRTAFGAVSLKRPIAYQERAAGRDVVGANYVLLDNWAVGVHVDAYDPALPLIIDPVISYSAIIGGTSTDHIQSVKVDGSGNAYFLGDTTSADFPSSSHSSGGQEVFVAKMNASGTALLYNVYLGSRKDDSATDAAIDANGNIFIAANTVGVDYPTTRGAYRQSGTGGNVVSKLSPTGTLIYSTYLGVFSTSQPKIAIDSAGNAVIASDDAGFAGQFVATPGALQAANAGSNDVVILKLNASGTALLFGTWLGAADTDWSTGVAVDASGNIYVTGQTASTSFPRLNGLPEGAHGSEFFPIFVAKVNSAGTALIYSTLIDGSGTDLSHSIAVDASGAAYIGGETFSSDFPIVNAFQPVKGKYPSGTGGWSNGFILKLAPAGNALVYSSYIGGSPCASGNCAGSDNNPVGDAVNAVRVDPDGSCYIAGRARSWNFPVMNSIWTGTVPANTYTPFVAKVSASGRSLDYSTRFSIPEAGEANGVDLDQAGNLYLGGWVRGTGFPSTLPLGPRGLDDAFVLKLISPPPVSVTLASSAPESEVGQSVVLTATVPAGTNITNASIAFFDDEVLIGATPLTSTSAALPISLAVGIHKLVAKYQRAGNGGTSPLLLHPVNQPANCN